MTVWTTGRHLRNSVYFVYMSKRTLFTITTASTAIAAALFFASGDSTQAPAIESQSYDPPAVVEQLPGPEIIEPTEQQPIVSEPTQEPLVTEPQPMSAPDSTQAVIAPPPEPDAITGPETVEAVGGDIVTPQTTELQQNIVRCSGICSSPQ